MTLDVLLKFIKISLNTALLYTFLRGRHASIHISNHATWECLYTAIADQLFPLNGL